MSFYSSIQAAGTYIIIILFQDHIKLCFSDKGIKKSA